MQHRSTRFDYRLLRQLLLFAVVTEERSIRRAAERLSLSQTPLITQLDELEARLKVKLLRRGPRGVVPTPEGEAVLPEVERLLREAEMLHYSVNELRAGARGIVRIGANLESMLSIVPALRAALATSTPDSTVFVKEIDSHDAERELLEHTSDLAVGYLPKRLDERLACRALKSEPPVVLLPANHTLARAEHITLAMLAAERWVFSARTVSPQLFDALTGLCQRAGFSPNIAHEVSGTMRQVAYVACAQGITMVPDYYRRMLPESVIARDIADAAPVLTISAAWRRVDEDTPLVHTLLELAPAHIL